MVAPVSKLAGRFEVPIPFRCFFPAWIIAWVTAVFLPSVVIAYLGISQAAAAIGTGFDRLPFTSWKVADDVGPVVKLMIGGLLLAGFLGLGRASTPRRATLYAASILVGLVAVAATIGLIPSALSRGFGGALTGNRFDPVTTSIYMLGGALAGVVFVVSSSRCQRGDASRTKRQPCI